MPIPRNKVHQDSAAALLATVGLDATALAALQKIGNILAGTYGTQIAKYVEDKMNSTDIIHTVTAAKTLYITSCWICWESGAGSRRNDILIRNASDVTVTKLLRTGEGAASRDGFGWTSFSPSAYAVPAGYDVCLVSANNNVSAGGFFGWEI